MTMTSCKKDGALALCGATVFKLGSAAGAARWSRARLLTSVSKPDTLPFKISKAPARAVSSSLRNDERWSQSFALASHCSVRSFKYNWSFFKTASASTSSSRFLAMSPVNVSTSVFSSSMACLFSSIFLDRSAMVSSKVFLATAQSSPSCVFSALKSMRSLSSVSIMPCEWYLYVGSAGSTVVPVCRNALTALCLGSEMRFMMSASARLLSTDSRMDIKDAAAGLDFSMALIAVSREEMALLRSASEASYTACSFWNCVSVAWRSVASSS
mmetsp:Transcript_74105/g.195325  ORF Transcript_74105/g.195325 Transcript_74105/m.195325 type:complete len:270 (-) Transcript_74105:393-1202(-)